MISKLSPLKMKMKAFNGRVLDLIWTWPDVCWGRKGEREGGGHICLGSSCFTSVFADNSWTFQSWKLNFWIWICCLHSIQNVSCFNFILKNNFWICFLYLLNWIFLSSPIDWIHRNIVIVSFQLLKVEIVRGMLITEILKNNY